MKKFTTESTKKTNCDKKIREKFKEFSEKFSVLEVQYALNSALLLHHEYQLASGASFSAFIDYKYSINSINFYYISCILSALSEVPEAREAFLENVKNLKHMIANIIDKFIPHYEEVSKRNHENLKKENKH